MCEDKTYEVKRCAFAKRNGFDCPHKYSKDETMIRCITMCDDCLDDKACILAMDKKWMRTTQREKERQERLRNSHSPQKI